jgi:hypothetical protein
VIIYREALRDFGNIEVLAHPPGGVDARLERTGTGEDFVKVARHCHLVVQGDHDRGPGIFHFGGNPGAGDNSRTPEKERLDDTVAERLGRGRMDDDVHAREEGD